jgi:hypothetical protein
MSLGNGNPKEGDKGSNFNYELKVLQGLEAIAVALENQTAPEVFTSSTGAVNGAGIIKSSTLLIPANTISTPGGVIEFIAKFYRISGTTNTISSYLFTNTSDTLTGASLLATGGAIITGVQMTTLARTMNYSGGLIKTLAAASLFASDYTAQPISSVAFNPAVDNYFIFATGVSAGDTAVCQSYRVTIY